MNTEPKAPFGAYIYRNIEKRILHTPCWKMEKAMKSIAKPLVISVAGLLLAGCASQPEPVAVDTRTPIYSKDGTIIGYDPTVARDQSGRTPEEIAEAKVGGVGEGNPRGFGEGARSSGGSVSAGGASGDDDNDDEDDGDG